MRHGRFNIEVGHSETSSSGTRRGNRHSIGFGGGSGTRIGNSYSSGVRSGHSSKRYYRKVSGWACKRHGFLKRLFVRALVALVLIWLAYGFLFGKAGKRLDSGVSSLGSVAHDATSPPARHRHSPDGEKTAGSSSDEPTDPSATEDAAPSPSVDSGGSPAITRAMDKALASGRPVRWHDAGRHGYAVPSEADGQGCRMIQVSTDETGESATPVKLCP